MTATSLAATHLTYIKQKTSPDTEIMTPNLGKKERKYMMTAKRNRVKSTTTDTEIGVTTGKETDREEKKTAIATEIGIGDETREKTYPIIAKDVMIEAKTPNTTAVDTMTEKEKEKGTAKNETETETQTAIELKTTAGIETATATVIETGEMTEGKKIVMVTKTSEIIAMAEEKTEETMAVRGIGRGIGRGRGREGLGAGAMWLLIAICLPVVGMTRRECARGIGIGIGSVCDDV